jgi:hypothetical protein
MFPIDQEHQPCVFDPCVVVLVVIVVAVVLVNIFRFCAVTIVTTMDVGTFPDGDGLALPCLSLFLDDDRGTNFASRRACTYKNA